MLSYNHSTWVHGGSLGDYASTDPATRTVVFDGSTTLLLRNLELPAGARYPVEVEFRLREGAQVNNYSYTVHLRQFLRDSEEVYGNVSFQINTSNTNGLFKTTSAKNTVAGNKDGRFSIYPNPANDKLQVSYLNNESVTVNLTVYDITGRKMLSLENQHLQNSFVELNVAGLTSGIYFINITNTHGISEQFKFVKQ